MGPTSLGNTEVFPVLKPTVVAFVCINCAVALPFKSVGLISLGYLLLLHAVF